MYPSQLIIPFTIAVVSAASSGSSSGASSGSSSEKACNPMKSSGCSPVKALATDIAVDFSSKLKYFKELSTKSGISYSKDDGLTMTLSKQLDNPAIKSDFYIMFGRVECQLKAAKGTGIVSSFYLQSDDLDEIDLEWLGGDDTQFQSNFFSKGNTETYDRGEYHDVKSAPQDDYHNYTLTWTEKETVWYFDGSPVRTLKNDTSSGYPQTPMYIKAGIWAGGDSSNEPGTIEWAGGRTDYSKAPFKMHIKDLSVSDYSTGSEYSYNDQSGKWTSIKAKGGSVNSRSGSTAHKADVEDDASSSVAEITSEATSSIPSTEDHTGAPSTSEQEDSSATHSEVHAPSTLLSVAAAVTSASTTTDSSDSSESKSATPSVKPSSNDATTHIPRIWVSLLLAVYMSF